MALLYIESSYRHLTLIESIIRLSLLYIVTYDINYYRREEKTLAKRSLSNLTSGGNFRSAFFYRDYTLRNRVLVLGKLFRAYKLLETIVPKRYLYIGLNLSALGLEKAK
jgi:hypothetical protein